MSLLKASLADKFDLEKDRIYLSGTQAIVRLMLMQKAIDRAQGHNTAGYATGYRGSPLGGLDQQFWSAGNLLRDNDIVFQAGVNEDIAATAIWGTQQVALRGDGRFDGVFGLWYGKGPGVDRAGDALRHANFAGTAQKGGVLAVMGDDHTCESSTTAHQSEFAFVDAMMPILNPAGVQEILDYGLYGYALSRFSGLWVGLKGIKDNIESTASVSGVPPARVFSVPDFDHPAGGLNIALGRSSLEQEDLLHNYRKPAALAFLRDNSLDRLVWRGGNKPRLGIASLGKSWLDTTQALDLLGIDEKRGTELGIRLYKIAVPWPLEPHGLRAFADGLHSIIVVEEKRALVETQIKEQLYGTANTPGIVGKTDETGQTLFPSNGALDANDIAIAIGQRILAYADDPAVKTRVEALRTVQQSMRSTREIARRTPHFCAGCPHNSSTNVPNCSRAYAGIGCHYLVLGMDRATDGYTHMGGEGGNWIGEAPFSKTNHVFQNIGDGTYVHSGSMTIRAAAIAGINITYKILFNDAVALTGGQKPEGGITVDEIARQMAAEGAKRIAVVSDEPDKYPPGTQWPAHTTFHHRKEIDAVQKELRTVKGLSILIYDQTCAAELRRQRKRGKTVDPNRRVFINPAVCEGCGDCGLTSNCVAIQPLDTPFGRKRKIDQSSCNKDYSCLEGFCPAFVTVHDGSLKKAAPPDAADKLPFIPEPPIPVIDRTMAFLIAGVGGTGVVTIGHILGMASHLQGYGVGLIDMAGLAQKGGSVTTHLKIGPTPDAINAIRIAAGEADTVLACDGIVAASPRALAAIRSGKTSVFFNTEEIAPGEFTRNADYVLPAAELEKAIVDRAGTEKTRIIDAGKLALALFGDAIATNMLMVGYAWQSGAIPLQKDAVFEAIRINGVAIDQNIAAFEWGRRAAHDPASVAPYLARNAGDENAVPKGLNELVDHRAAHLARYQNKAFADTYRQAIDRIAQAEAVALPGRTDLAETVATSLHRLMAIKDEYEIARLYADPEFSRTLASTFIDHGRLEFHLAPPILSRIDPLTGRPQKRTFGPWMLRLFGVLASMKGLRGTRFDPFGRIEERRWERQLHADYAALLDELISGLSDQNHHIAVALAAYPQDIRGYGPVKRAQAKTALARRDELLAAFRRSGSAPMAQAAE
ncbi:MAG: indolepyruvate ferredoxin oxidoreductase family protein [Alphaproteobacteria bacterium]